MIGAAPAACPSMKIAAFTAQTKAIMVMIAASPAAHHGLALNRCTRTKTSTANGTAISEMRNCPGRPTSWSISVGNNGVKMPDTRPPAAIASRLLRTVSADVIAWVNAQLHLWYRPTRTLDRSCHASQITPRGDRSCYRIVVTSSRRT
jgi:hypothetical protein